MQTKEMQGLNKTRKQNEDAISIWSALSQRLAAGISLSLYWKFPFRHPAFYCCPLPKYCNPEQKPKIKFRTNHFSKKLVSGTEWALSLTLKTKNASVQFKWSRIMATVLRYLIRRQHWYETIQAKGGVTHLWHVTVKILIHRTSIKNENPAFINSATLLCPYVLLIYHNYVWCIWFCPLLGANLIHVYRQFV